MKKETMGGLVTRLITAKKGKIIFENTRLDVNESVEGESLEDKIERLVSNGEDGDEGVGSIYTERKDGVLPAYDIRTDRMEVALEAMDKAHRWDLAKRGQNIEERAEKTETKEIVKEKNDGKSDGETESTGGL